MRAKTALLAVAISAGHQLHAGEGPVSGSTQICAQRVKEVSPLDAPCRGGWSNSFPMTYREGFIWVQVKVPQTSTPLNFLLDTGAGVSVLNRSTAEKLGLHAGNPIAVQGVGTNTVGLWPQPLAATAGKVALPQNYLTLDLGALSGSCACPVDGIIGIDFFQDRVVTVDFSAGRVVLDAPGLTTDATEDLPLKCRNRAFLVPLCVNGRKKEWFRLDTGCASALQWVTNHKPTVGGKTRTAVALSKISIDEMTTSVKLGRTTFSNVVTGAHGQSIFTGEAGLLGNGLLSRFNALTIDAKAGRIVLQRNAHELTNSPAVADTD